MYPIQSIDMNASVHEIAIKQYQFDIFHVSSPAESRQLHFTIVM